MFSTRLPWHTPENALAARIAARRLAPGARPLLDLTSTNPTTAGIPVDEAVRARVTAALDDTRALTYAPDAAGPRATREAIARYYREAHGKQADPDRITLTASTSEAYGWLLKLLCDPGDAVLVPTPSYPLFEHLAALESVRPLAYPLAFDDRFHLDGALVERALDEAEAAGARVKALFVVSPNNPTGSWLDEGTRRRLVALAAARGLPIVADEVFADYPLALPSTTGRGEAARVPTLVDETGACVFVLSGLSKVLGLPQLKLGWIHVAGPEAIARAVLPRLELVADTYLSVSTPIALATPTLLAERPALGGAIHERVRASLAALRRALDGSAATVLPVEGGWAATLRLPRTRSDEAWTLALLDDADVLVQPGYFFDYREEALVVVSLLTPPDVMAEGAARIAHLASSLD